MADSTRVSEKELERRESYLTSGIRDYNIADPFTWKYPFKAAALMVTVGVVAAQVSNRWNKKPYYYALFPRTLAFAALGALGYGLGSLREYHYRTRDAVVEHYISLHPQDFDRFNDRSGRPYSQVLLPWVPRRAQYNRYD